MPEHIKQAIVEKLYEKYKSANKKEKTQILDHFCELTDLNRKYAIEKLKHFKDKDRDKPKIDRRGKTKKYSDEAEEVLIQIWKNYEKLCALRLHPYLHEAIDKLVQFGYLQTSESVLSEVRNMSLAKVKRLVSQTRHHNGEHGISTTKPGRLLKNEIPIKTKSWDESRTGYCEIDLVAHCGNSALGDFINTLQFVDINTTWTERRAVLTKSKEVVLAAIKKIRKKLPFELKGIDSDNGSEFLNHRLKGYCDQEGIEFTRSRPYMKRDNAHIEQKNYPYVRKVIGYDRFCTKVQLDAINDLYDNELRLFFNFFQPSMKLKSKTRVNSKYKKVYDEAKTPYQRVLESEDVPQKIKDELKSIYKDLDPVKLLKEIKIKLEKLYAIS